MTDREFDVVLFGASGFVGALTAAHLARSADAGARVALAGRSRDRLAEVRRKLPARAQDWPLVAVDAMDAAGLRRLAARTTALATMVGPYLRDGREVVRAAANEGTHYADLTGEVLFVRWSLDEVADRAHETGARIVHSCGFDSIPSDLGVLLIAERAAADGQGTLVDATLVVRELRGGISGGTIDSARQQAIAAQDDPAARRLLADPYGLSPRRSEEPAPTASRRGGVRGRLRGVAGEREPGTGHWLAPFVMASYNTRVVRMSNTLTDWSYGRGLRYREVVDVGPGLPGAVRSVAIAAGVGALFGAMSWTPTRAVVDRVLPKPGEGPSEERRVRGRFSLDVDATTTTGARYRATVGAPLDPGYDATAVMLGQSALCLALDGDRLPDRAGVLTPATAMGDALIARLRAAGFTLEIDRVG